MFNFLHRQRAVDRATVIQLGDKVKDRVSGLVGIVVSRHEYMYGCIRCAVQPQELKDGKPIDAAVIDEPQLELLEVGAVKNVPLWREEREPAQPARTAAGPRPDVTRPAAPTRS